MHLGKFQVSMLVVAMLVLQGIGFAGATSDQNDFVPQQLIVKFKEGVELKLSQACGVMMTGDITLDRLSMQFQVTTITKLIPHGGIMDRWYILMLGKDVDTLEALAAYREHPSVEYAEPNYTRKPFSSGKE